MPGFVRKQLVERQIRVAGQAQDLPEERVLNDVIPAPHAIKRLIEPEEVAAAVAMLLGPPGELFTGTTFTMDLGWAAR